MLTLLVSIISGGLAGGIVSAISNRIFHWRALRTQFYPERVAYYWITTTIEREWLAQIVAGT